MAKYSVKVTLIAPDGVSPGEIADHCASACKHWGGQYHPDDGLFSSEVEAKAECRGAIAQTDGFDE